MAVWMVRAGKSGQREDLALEEGLAVVGWDELPDLAKVTSRGEMRKLCEKVFPNASKSNISNTTGQLWGFKGRMQIGDIVALPLKTRSAIALGEVIGDYRYIEGNPAGAKHTRQVKWIREDIPRSRFRQDLLSSLGAFMTVCQIKRNEAEKRIRCIIEGGEDPLLARKGKITADEEPSEEEDAKEIVDLEQYALDRIRHYIGTRFKAHDLTRIVNEVLKAQGYHTYMSAAGPDGGVDVLAGNGAMGFDRPKLCVQVKSGDTPEDVKTLRELQGVMINFGADSGLLVSWSGFTKNVYSEAKVKFFEIRLWDADELVGAILKHYEKLSDELQAEIPLKRIWAIVLEEEE